jgi:hypothetical protein
MSSYELVIVDLHRGQHDAKKCSAYQTELDPMNA